MSHHKLWADFDCPVSAAGAEEESSHPWGVFKLEVAKGHPWLCPCLMASAWAGFAHEVVAMPPFLSEPLCPLPGQAHPLYQHAPWKTSLSQFLFLWHSSILRRVSSVFPASGKSLFYFPFIFFPSFLSIDTGVWTPQRAKSRWDSPSSWAVSNPSGIEALAVSQRRPFMPLFCLPG